jgi:hypothetical protein
VSEQWRPKNWEEACRRNAGRRKLHMRKRKQRADRILRLLAAMEAAPELRETSYGWLRLTAKTLKTSTATVSRDFALCRRLHSQFERMFGRPFELRKDQIKWSWNRSHYGFRTRESIQAGHKKPVGQFPFDTRIRETKESFCGFGPASWQSNAVATRESATDNLLSALQLLKRFCK